MARPEGSDEDLEVVPVLLRPVDPCLAAGRVVAIPRGRVEAVVVERADDESALGEGSVDDEAARVGAARVDRVEPPVDLGQHQIGAVASHGVAQRDLATLTLGNGRRALDPDGLPAEETE